MNIRKIIGAAVAVMMLFAFIPVSLNRASADADWIVPEGYDEYEYGQVAAFLEIEDENGVKNGVKLNEDYDVNDLSTWDDGHLFFDYIPDLAPFHIWSIGWDGREMDEKLYGDLDVSGFSQLDQLTICWNDIPSVNAPGCIALYNVLCDHCNMTSLDLSDCVSLFDIQCNNNELSYLNLEGCEALEQVFCAENQLSELDLSTCTAMKLLSCGNNNLSSLNVDNCDLLQSLLAKNNKLETVDLSDCVSLNYIDLSDNLLRSIDISNCPELAFDTITAVGNGTVGYVESPNNSTIILSAVPNENETFIGWYDGEELLSTDETWTCYSTDEDLRTDVTAVFSSHILGDVDCNGLVEAADMSLLSSYLVNNPASITEQGMLNANANEDSEGKVDVLDLPAIWEIMAGSVG